MLLSFLGFVFVSLLIMAAAMALAPSPVAALERRLSEVAALGGTIAPDDGFDRTVVDTLKKIGNAVPRSTSEMSKLRQRLITAGYRNNEALVIFLGIRVAFALLLFALFAMPIFIK